MKAENENSNNEIINGNIEENESNEKRKRKEMA